MTITLKEWWNKATVEERRALMQEVFSAEEYARAQAFEWVSQTWEQVTNLYKRNRMSYCLQQALAHKLSAK